MHNQRLFGLVVSLRIRYTDLDISLYVLADGLIFAALE